MSREIPEEAEELLTSEPLVAHLGTCHDTNPHVAPLWYTVRDGAIEITTTGRKLENIRQNDRVALSVQKDEDGHPRWGVTVQGTATVVDDEAESQEVAHRINRKYGVEADAWSENTAVRIEISRVNHWEY